jgi:hypothetical protein
MQAASACARSRSFMRLDHGISQLSIRVVERNDALNISCRIENLNLARPKARPL